MQSPLILPFRDYTFCYQQNYLYSLLNSFACFTVIAAGTAFKEAAQIQLNMLSSKHDAGQRYVDAGNCYKKTDVEGLLFVG